MKKKETINDRVRTVRKALKMTQQDFADKIKLKSGNTFSMIEKQRIGVTDQNILLICTPNQLEDGITVNETWLRNGGDPSQMFINNPPPDPDNEADIFDRDQKPLPKEERELVGIYRQLTKPNKYVARKQIDVLLEGQEAAGEKGERRADTTKKPN